MRILVITDVRGTTNLILSALNQGHQILCVLDEDETGGFEMANGGVYEEISLNSPDLAQTINDFAPQILVDAAKRTSLV